MALLASFAAALFASVLLSFGMVLQKRNVAFIGHRGKRDAAFERRRLGWIAGFSLINLAPVFNYLALLSLPANVVAAVAGSNVAFAALFAALLLGEEFRMRSLVPTIFLFAAIALAALRGAPASAAPRLGFVWLFFALPALGATVALLLRKKAKGPILAAVIGGIAGSAGGFMLIPLKLLGSLPPTAEAWLGSPWIWLYLAAGAGSFGIVQLAYKDGAMNRVAPAYYGLQVLWPALAALSVFSLPFDPIQWLAFGIIGACVVVLSSS